MLTEVYTINSFVGFKNMKIVEKTVYDLKDQEMVSLLGTGMAITNLNRKDYDKFVGVITTEMNYSGLYAVLDAVLPYNVELRQTVIDYYGIEYPNSNELTVKTVVNIIRKGLERDEFVDHHDDLQIVGLTVGNFKEYRLLNGAYILIEPAVGIELRNEKSKIELFIFPDESIVRFYNGEPCHSLDGIEEMGKYIPRAIQSFKTAIDVKPIFEIVGTIDLSDYVQPSVVKEPWLKKMCLKLKINSHGLIQDQILDKIYETLNHIAVVNADAVKHTYFLLDRKYVKRVLIESNNSIMLSDQFAIAYMARVNGCIVTQGTPLFDESTLKGGAVWYLAELVSE